MKTARRLIAVLLCAALVCGLSGCSGKFDAKAYTEAVLNHTFQGESDEAAILMKDKTRAELIDDYDDGIYSFTELYITGGAELSDQMSGMYLDLTKNIFSAMRYRVKSAQKTGSKEYKVTVEINPADVFAEYIPKLKAESDDLVKRVQAGEFKGSEDEISTQVQVEYTNRAYTLLQEAYLNIGYGDAEDVVLTVKENDKKVYTISDDEIADLIVKILRLDEI